jgi:hypothetical protein
MLPVLPERDHCDREGAQRSRSRSGLVGLGYQGFGLVPLLGENNIVNVA